MAEAAAVAANSMRLVRSVPVIASSRAATALSAIGWLPKHNWEKISLDHSLERTMSCIPHCEAAIADAEPTFSRPALLPAP